MLFQVKKLHQSKELNPNVSMIDEDLTLRFKRKINSDLMNFNREFNKIVLQNCLDWEPFCRFTVIYRVDRFNSGIILTVET